MKLATFYVLSIIFAVTSIATSMFVLNGVIVPENIITSYAIAAGISVIISSIILVDHYYSK